MYSRLGEIRSRQDVEELETEDAHRKRNALLRMLLTLLLISILSITAGAVLTREDLDFQVEAVPKLFRGLGNRRYRPWRVHGIANGTVEEVPLASLSAVRAEPSFMRDPKD